MIDQLGFFNSDQLIVSLSVTIMLLITFLYFESKRIGQKDRVVRMSFTTLWLFSLLMIYLEPYYSESDNNDLTLVYTKGNIHEDSLRATHPNARVVYWSDSVREGELIGQVIIDGYGVPTYDLWKLNGKKVIKLDTELPHGIIDYKYSEVLKLGERANFQFKTSALKDHRILLSVLGISVDSLTIIDNDEQVSLNYKPTIAGKFVYKVLVSDSLGNTIYSEPLPITIEPKQKLKVLLLNKQPTFETRFLKNYLIEEGHFMFSRSEITTNRYTYENVGFDFKRMNRLTNDVLNNFDLLITSMSALKAMPASQLSVLKNQIQQEGLGLLLLIDDFSVNLPTWLKFEFAQPINNNSERITLKIDEEEIELDRPSFSLKPQKLSEAVVVDQALYYAISKPLGKGMVSATVLSNTFKLALSGQGDKYKLLWNKQINSVLKDDLPSVSFDKKLNYAHIPLKIDLVSDQKAPELRYQNEIIPLIQHEFVLQRWSSIFWPVKNGWQQLQLYDKHYYFYVFDDSDWESARAFETIQINREFSTSNKITDRARRLVRVPIPLWWFYLIFLGSAGYLWLQPKLQ